FDGSVHRWINQGTDGITRYETSNRLRVVIPQPTVVCQQSNGFGEVSITHVRNSRPRASPLSAPCLSGNETRVPCRLCRERGQRNCCGGVSQRQNSISINPLCD